LRIGGVRQRVDGVLDQVDQHLHHGVGLYLHIGQ
jgi:hypothetical protein